MSSVQIVVSLHKLVPTMSCSFMWHSVWDIAGFDVSGKLQVFSFLLLDVQKNITFACMNFVALVSLLGT